MNKNKLMIAAFLAVSFFLTTVYAREFEVFVKGEGLVTLQNTPVAEYQVINITGKPGAIEIPTYGEIRKAVAESLNIEPHWTNFTIKYLTKSNGKFYFLKPHIEKLSRKDRGIFLNTIAMEGYKDMPVLIIAKREMKAGIGQQVTPIMHEGKGPKEAIRAEVMPEEGQEVRIMPISTEEEMEVPSAPIDMPPAPKIHHVKTEEMIVPEWLFDETLVGESDPVLLEELYHAEEMYGQ